MDKPANTPPLPFITAKELGERTPEIPDFITRGFLVRGSITELSAKIKAGKTTLVCHILQSIVNSQSFMSFETKKTSVLYLTEERESTFRAVLSRAGLLDTEDIHILSLPRTVGTDWPTIARISLEKAREVDASLVVVDTLSRWAKIHGDDENSAGAAAAAMEPLEQIAAGNVAVLVIRHDKKGEYGEIGESGRGSSAFGGAADIIINLQRANSNGHPNRRNLFCVTRYDDLPEQMVLELREGVYIEVEELEREQVKTLLLSVLATKQFSEKELEQHIGCARSTLRDALSDLVEAGVVSRAKEGRSYTYWID